MHLPDYCFYQHKPFWFAMKQKIETCVDSSQNVWINLWKTTKFSSLPLWEDLCELVYNLLRALLSMDVKNKNVLEAGSGTGRISLRLATEGANVLLLDISPAAIRFSKRAFKSLHLSGLFVVGDIFHLPFKESALDIVWNSGVLEHYGSSEQKKAFDEALRVLRKQGSCVIIVPNNAAPIYNFFRKLDIKTGRWKFGSEEPMSLSEPNLPKPIARFSHGSIYQLNFISFPLIGTAIKVTIGFLLHILPIFSALDKKGSGYLVGGLWRKGDISH
jgi:ubiquinone/menaquinone biosynthesis C-methylase UbiE